MKSLAMGQHVWLWCLAFGAFTVGTECFMLTGLLPSIASNFSISAASVGYLTTAYAVTYALSAPILAAFTSGMNPRRVLITGSLVFGIANLVAAIAPTYSMLLSVRVVLALSAALFMPAAFAYTGIRVAINLRGRAFSVLTGAMSAAIAFGTPLATLIANLGGWRLTFIMVGVVSLLVTVALLRTIDDSPSVSKVLLRTRLKPIQDIRILSALGVPFFWTMGSFSAFVYLAMLLKTVADIDNNQLALALFISGASGVVGSVLGGWIVDLVGPRRTQSSSLLIFAVVMSSFPIMGMFSVPKDNHVIALLAVGLWGGVSWTLNTAQQVRLLQLAPNSITFVLSLNSSAIYLGIAFGSAIGAIVLTTMSPLNLGWVATCCELLAFAVLQLSLWFEKHNKNEVLN